MAISTCLDIRGACSSEKGPRLCPVPESQPDLARPRLLVAEDDPDLAQALAILLGDAYDVSIRDRGRDFAQSFEVERPDVMVVDYQLPDINGLRLVESLWRRHGRATPAIMISAYSNRREASIEAGFEAFLHKPYEAQALACAIERAIRAH
ncbi:MAG: response regulator [bacterium]|nr:response regulator [bacterium]